MLRFLQERVNKQTKKIEEAPAEQKGQPDFDNVSKKQDRVKDLMRRLAVKLGKENDVEEGR